MPLVFGDGVGPSARDAAPLRRAQAREVRSQPFQAFRVRGPRDLEQLLWKRFAAGSRLSCRRCPLRRCHQKVGGRPDCSWDRTRPIEPSMPARGHLAHVVLFSESACFVALATASTPGSRTVSADLRRRTNPPSREQSRRQEESFSLHFPAFHRGDTQYQGAARRPAQPDRRKAAPLSPLLDPPLAGRRVLFNPEMSGGKGLSKKRSAWPHFRAASLPRRRSRSAIYPARIAISQTFGLGGGTVGQPADQRSSPGRAIRPTSPSRRAVSRSSTSSTPIDTPTTPRPNFPGALFGNRVPRLSGGHARLHVGRAGGSRSRLVVASRRASRSCRSTRTSRRWTGHRQVGEVSWRNTKCATSFASYRRFESAPLSQFARMGSTSKCSKTPRSTATTVAADAAKTVEPSTGLLSSVEQQLTHSLGAFMTALSWNDGHNESWAFTEIDRSIAVGVTQNGGPWNRPNDVVGAAVVVSGLSDLHRRYLAGGGIRFHHRRRKLSLTRQKSSDFYYRSRPAISSLSRRCTNPSSNPAYNSDRGPFTSSRGASCGI